MGRRRLIVRIATALALVAGACGDTSPADTTVVGTTTTIPTTTLPTTTEPDPPTTTAPPAELEPGAPVVANVNGIFVIDGPAATQLTDDPADTVVSDLAGGLVYQHRNAVFWLPATAGAPTIVVAGADDGEDRRGAPWPLRLQDVAEFDGSAHVVYLERTGPDEAARETIWLHSLETGKATPLLDIPVLETGIQRASYGGGVFVLSWSGEGDTWFEFVDVTGEPVAMPNPSPPEQGVAPWTPLAAISPDGGLLVYLESEQPDYEGPTSVDLVVFDLEAGREDRRLSLASSERQFFSRIDFDGFRVVVSGTTIDGDRFVPVTPLFVDIDPDAGMVVDLGVAGTASLMK